MAIIMNGQTLFPNRVLSVGVSVDSLWETDRHYAIVWDEAADRADRIDTGTRHWGGASGGFAQVTIDADYATIRKAAARVAAAARSTRELENLEYAARLAKGKVVEVYRGRKVAPGTTGELFWMGEGTYGMRVGLKDAQGTVHWTSADNVRVANPAEYVTETADELDRCASHAAERAYPEARAALAAREGADHFRLAVEKIKYEVGDDFDGDPIMLDADGRIRDQRALVTA